MKISFATDVGKVRETNEDHLFTDEKLGLFIVADGMGGHQAGEVASETAVKVISNFIRVNIGRGLSIPTLIEESIFTANEDILKKAIRDSSLDGMGTTVVLALLNEGSVHIANVGDSRAYLIRGSTIEQLTKDHSLVGDLVRKGQITKEEARVHPKRNILTMALGIEGVIELDIAPIDFQKGDYILLCSDGLTDMLTDEEIRDIVLSSKDIEGPCKNLVASANEKGGRDNITLISILKDE